MVGEVRMKSWEGGREQAVKRDKEKSRICGKDYIALSLSSLVS